MSLEGRQGRDKEARLRGKKIREKEPPFGLVRE